MWLGGPYRLRFSHPSTRIASRGFSKVPIHNYGGCTVLQLHRNLPASRSSTFRFTWGPSTQSCLPPFYLGTTPAMPRSRLCPTRHASPSCCGSHAPDRLHIGQSPRRCLCETVQAFSKSGGGQIQIYYLGDSLLKSCLDRGGFWRIRIHLVHAAGAGSAA